MLPCRIPIVAMLIFLLGGCAHYEYDLVQPANLAQHIAPKSLTSFNVDPVGYAAKSDSNRLVLQVKNSSTEPLKLLGDDSFAVDPNGESHPLETRTIAPNSSITLNFPPIRPTFRQSGPALGVGVGVGVSSANRYGYYGRHGVIGDPFLYDDGPKYYRLEDDGTRFWDWDGDGTEISVRLTYQRGSETFHHDFTFKRVKK